MTAFMPSRGANALEAALEGSRGVSPATSELALLARELRSVGLAVPMPQISQIRREELRRAVLARSAEQQAGGLAARFRGATFGIAAVAGAGLVVATAASGSNPALLVVQAARELPRLGYHGSPPATVSIEGEVIGTHDGGRTLEIRSGDETFVVESPRETRSVTAEGTPFAAADIEQGANVRVTTDRDSDSKVVTATKIEVLPNTAAASDPRPGAATGNTGPTEPRPTLDSRPTVTNATPKPADTPKPTYTQPPAAIATLNGDPAAVQPTSTPEPTKTPTPRPTATPTTRPKPTTPAPVEYDTNDATAGSNASTVPPVSN